MLSEAEQEALSKIKAYLDASHTLDAIRGAGWGSWIDHLEAKGIDLAAPNDLSVQNADEATDRATGDAEVPIGSGEDVAQPDTDRKQSGSRILPIAVGLFSLAAFAVLALVLIGFAADTYNPLDILGDGDDPLKEIVAKTCVDLASASPSQAGAVLQAGDDQARAEGFATLEFETVLRLDECPESATLVELVQVAEDACLEFEDAIVLQVGGILNRAISRAEDIEFDGPDLGDAMRSDCPGLMSAIEQVGEDQEEREREQERRERLPDLMTLAFECGSDQAYGAVRNNSNVTVDVFIDVQFLNVDGVLVDDSIDSISGLRPGETGYWDAPFLSRGRPWATCRAEVNSAFEQ